MLAWKQLGGSGPAPCVCPLCLPLRPHSCFCCRCCRCSFAFGFWNLLSGFLIQRPLIRGWVGAGGEGGGGVGGLALGKWDPEAEACTA